VRRRRKRKRNKERKETLAKRERCGKDGKRFPQAN
jgi:hypothetical protein